MIDLPQKIVCVGLNYRDHAEEQGVALPERPLLFAKWPNTLLENGAAIRIPAISKRVDYEAELGVVIGRRASGVTVDDALDFVAGYVVANDVSGRDLQFADGQWVRGKSLDTFLPVGDLVPASSVPDPQALPIRAILNGEVMQDSTPRTWSSASRRSFRSSRRRSRSSRATSSSPARPPESARSATRRSG